MKIGKAILIASLAIPVLVFFTIVIIGIVSMGVDLINHPGNLSGIFNAAITHAYIAFFLSTLPIIVLGYPISVYAHKRGFLNKRVVLIGAPILGGIVVSFIFSSFAENLTMIYFVQVFILGALGGLFVGVIFLKVLKPDMSVTPAAEKGD